MKVELISVSEFAKRKNVTRRAIYKRISSGSIQPDVIADKLCIDWEKYKNLEVKQRVK